MNSARSKLERLKVKTVKQSGFKDIYYTYYKKRFKFLQMNSVWYVKLRILRDLILKFYMDRLQRLNVYMEGKVANIRSLTKIIYQLLIRIQFENVLKYYLNQSCVFVRVSEPWRIWHSFSKVGTDLNIWHNLSKVETDLNI